MKDKIKQLIQAGDVELGIILARGQGITDKELVDIMKVVIQESMKPVNEKIGNSIGCTFNGDFIQQYSHGEHCEELYIVHQGGIQGEFGCMTDVDYFDKVIKSV